VETYARVAVHSYSYSDFLRVRRFAGLDGLRAISIGLVLFFHLPRTPGTNPLIQNAQDNGSIGVSLFFVISGFLISTLLLREQQQSGRISLRKFFLRRAFRLLPLYYAMLALVFAIATWTTAFTPHSRAILQQHALGYWLYFSNWLPAWNESPLFFSWSIAAEEQFYLVFGFLMFAVTSRSALLAVVIALVVKTSLALLVGSVAQSDLFWRIVLSCQEPILWGVLVGFLLNSKTAYSKVGTWLKSPLVCGTAALAFVAWLLLPHGTAAATERLVYPGLAVVVGGVAIRRRIPILDSAVLSHVGKVSYGMYLIHWFVTVVIERMLPPGTPLAVFFALQFGTTVAVASILFRWFEQPCIAFARSRFGTAPHRSVEAETPAIKPTFAKV
jgi:peptidoglycan/LPS O-acetylase OafA/YrhL